MTKGRTTRQVLTLAALMLAAGACRYLTTRIGDIAANPSDYLGREVTVAGEATDVVSLPFLPGAYSIKDTTGQMVVITDGQPPPGGTSVRISARVESAMTVGGRAIGVHLRETHRY